MDHRIENIFREVMEGDKSFQEKPSALAILFGKYNPKHQRELRETWEMGIKHGIEIGLHRASLEGQRLELYHNVQNPKHKEFLDKFYKLAGEYDCAIQYHFGEGMCVVDRTYSNPIKK